MTWLRRKKRPYRWTLYDVARADEIARWWAYEHPGEFAWFAHSPREEDEMRERFARRGITDAVVPVYPPRLKP